jgi:catechol 2,3-dioxygenase-like lactoylglutathione lyase family enzyme
MDAYVEHANIYVSDLGEAVRFLTTALPEFQFRGCGINKGTKWLHVGTPSSYLALNETSDTRLIHATKLNHVGFVVDDVASTKARLLEAGYEEGFIADPDDGRLRLYFLDRDGLEWEFVQYLTDDPALRNRYGA